MYGRSLSALVCSMAAPRMVRSYAAKSAIGGSLMGLGKGKKVGKIATVEKVVMPVETDPQRLVNYVCGSNIYKEGEDIKIKPDSEYPDWLWSMRTGKPQPLSELDPTTKEYWLRVRRAGIRDKNYRRMNRWW